MFDPAYDSDDFRQDAELAVAEGRLTRNGVGTAIRNATRSSLRRGQTRSRNHNHFEAYERARRAERSVVEILANSEEAVESGRVLIKANPETFCILLLCALGLPRDRVAEIAGCSPGTVSRAHRKAARLVATHCGPRRKGI